MSRPGERLIEWILTRRRLVLGASLVLAVAGAVAATRLPIKADFSALLPPSTESVQHLEAIQQRVRAFGTAYILVEADDPAVRARAAEEVRDAVDRLDRSLVTRVTIDDGPLRRFVWKNRYLFVEETDLEEARAALEEKIKQGKLEANPLYIDLDDEEANEAAPPDPRIEDLRQRLDEAEKDAAAPKAFVSRDGRLQLIIVQASFPAGQVSRTRVLYGELQRITGDLQHRHPGVRVGMTGDVATTLSEHRSILYGMLQSAAVTTVLVALLLFVAYRSIPAIGALLWALAVGTLVTLGLTKLLIGHFNIATAFLSAIVLGNGINPGIIFLSRFRDELRRGDKDSAVARAMAGAARGSLTAALTATIAYASLAVTDFRGFRHFGVIAGIGMAVCWVAAFTVLPAAVSWLNDRRAIRFRPSRVARLRLARFLPRSPMPLAALGLAATFTAGWGAYRYLSGNPLEKDWRKLRSDSAEIAQQRAWNDRISAEIQQGAFSRNLSGRFAVVLERRDQVKPLVDELRARDRAVPPERTLLAEVRSLDDALPKRQAEKLVLLAELRRLIDDELVDELKGEDREELLRLRPPDDLRAIGDRDVPEELAWPFIERDGTVGRIMFASNSNRFDSWNVSDLVQFSDEVRELELPEGALIGGQAFVFADMLRAMERDGPRAILLSLAGSVVVILLLLGRGRHGLLTVMATLAGTAGMVALAGVFGLKVNFLDFIALPITIGIGADYAANIAARELDEPHASMSQVILTSGGAVLLCSLTTVIGYGSLLVSDNAGIRSFGLAAILGELTCLAAALMLCPSLLWLLRRRGGAAGSLHRTGDLR